MLHLWSGRSRDFVLMFQKTTEMEFSDRVGIENAQVYVSTPSELQERCRLEPSPQGTRSSEAEEGKWICPRFNSPRSSFWVCIRLCTQLFQREILGAHSQATRQMKGLAYLTSKITSKISISSPTYVQSASKQPHRYHYTSSGICVSQIHAIWRTK